MSKKVELTDTVLRDAHQSLLATRMRTEDMLPIAEKLDRVGYWSLEAWGGATFDACLRFLKEDPWDRLRSLRKAIPNTRLQMLLRGQNLLGYRHYPDDLLRKFIERAAKNGIDVFRIFDALNDKRNMREAIKEVKRQGAIAEACVCYTTSPVHNNNYFVDMSVKLAELGADTICIKDMAGLLAPPDAYEIVKGIKKKTGLPVHLHCHETSGMGTVSYYKAVEAGADILDTAISSMASGTAHPPTETLVAALKGTEYDTGLDLSLLEEIAVYFRDVRKKYGQFESEHTRINTSVLVSQIPGGMISNLASQLKEQDALDRMDEVLKEVPNVRKDLGYPPLVTPTSQIVGTQATLNVLTGEKYKVITSETKNYLKGLYGKPTTDINEEVRKRAIGDEEIITCRPADLLEPELDKLTREVGVKAKSIEDILTYAMFPNVALEFFEQRESGTLQPEPLIPPEEAAGAARAPHLAPSEFNIKVHGESYHIKIGGAGHKGEGERPFYIVVDGQLEEALVESLVEVVPSYAGQIEGQPTVSSSRPKAKEEGDVTSPMPGSVVRVEVKVGDKVTAGDTVLVVEAMKMENEVHTPIDGEVKEIFVKEGDTVNPDETLVRIG